MDDRGQYGNRDKQGNDRAVAPMLVLAIGLILVSPVIGIVGGSALAIALSGRGGKQGD